MYAIIQTGGKQYRVAEGEIVRIEKLDQETGSDVQFDQILLVSKEDKVTVGKPTVAGAKVLGEIVDQTRGKKVEIIKFKRRKHQMKRQGHRQYYTDVKITQIDAE
jgi:large subunit ribosomal protein L21